MVATYLVTTNFHHNTRLPEVRRWELKTNDDRGKCCRSVSPVLEKRAICGRAADGSMVKGEAYKLRQG
jgi:hypothetical protein